MLLPSERASFCKPCFSSCRLAEDSRAANTQNYCLCMAEDGGDFIASWAFYIHEIGIGALHQALLLVFPLLLFWRGMKKILCERHVLVTKSKFPNKALVSRTDYILLNPFSRVFQRKKPYPLIGISCTIQAFLLFN